MIGGVEQTGFGFNLGNFNLDYAFTAGTRRYLRIDSLEISIIALDISRKP